jgi:hypothetical protein
VLNRISTSSSSSIIQQVAKGHQCLDLQPHPLHLGLDQSICQAAHQVQVQTQLQTTQDLEDFGLEQQLEGFWDIFLDQGIMLDISHITLAISISHITLDMVLQAGAAVAMGLDGDPVHMEEEGQAVHHPARAQGQPQVLVELNADEQRNMQLSFRDMLLLFILLSCYIQLHVVELFSWTLLNNLVNFS